MVAQGRALVLRAEQAAPLKFRHHAGADIVEPLRHEGEHHVEAVAGLPFQPFRHPVGDLLRRADEGEPAIAADAAGELAHGRPRAAGIIHDLRLPALARIRLGDLGERRVEVEAGGVRAEADRKVGEPALDRHQRVEPRLLLPGLLLGTADHDEGAGQDLQGIAGPARRRHPALHVGVELLARLQRGGGTEHHLGGLRRDLAPGLGGAGLHDHRPSLDRARDVERPLHLQEFAPVVQGVELLRIEEEALLDVAQERIVRPGIPQAGDDLEELAGPGVAGGVVEMRVAAEVQRLVGIAGGDEVPAGPAPRDVVERGELAGDVVGLVVGGGGGGDQPDPLRHHGQRRQQRQRIERGDGGRALQRLHRHVHHRQMVGHEEGVELGRLQGSGEAHEVVEVEVRVRKAAGIAPPRRVDADGAHEGAEMEVSSGFAHGSPPAASKLGFRR
ncbi:hypothetical protein CHKEEEPN_4532 [Methylorubrum podarium]|nr:hypothetical protein CHKEEEPN_4532 [Methylorubrum podarium]